MESHARRIVAPLPAKPDRRTRRRARLLHLIALTVLLVFDVTGAAATGAGPSYDWIDPFRWG